MTSAGMSMLTRGNTLMDTNIRTSTTTRIPTHISIILTAG
jgi:hypothetical protein